MDLNKITSKAVEADAKYMIDVDTVDGIHGSVLQQFWALGSSELTISSGVVTITNDVFYDIDTEVDASIDDLTTISGGEAGEVIIIRAEDATHTVVIKHDVGNILLQGGYDLPLVNQVQLVMLRYNGTDWVEVASAGNRIVVFGYNLGTETGIVKAGDYGDVPFMPPVYLLGIYAMADQSGSLSIDIRTETFGTIPDSADSIGTSPVFVMSTQQTKSETTFSGITREHGSKCWRFIATGDATSITQVAIVCLAVRL
jgi:hypothetical protein